MRFALNKSAVFLTLVFALVLATSCAARGDVNKVGNGGNAVVCEDETEKVRLLDLYEAKEPGNFISLEGSPTYEKFVDAAIDRIAQSSAKLGIAYRNRWKEFPDQVEWITDKKLAKVEDSLHAEEPLKENCKIAQLAIRLDKILDGEKRFHVRKDLWDQLSPVGQAALVTHEILYQHFSRIGEKDSRSVRKINRLLFAKNYEPKDFWKLVKDLRIPIYPD